jgi:hypothetical protein
MRIYIYFVNNSIYFDGKVYFCLHGWDMMGLSNKSSPAGGNNASERAFSGT